MKRAFLTILLFTAITSVSGQGYRTMSVWHNGEAKDYPLVTFDSLAAAEREGKAMIYYNRNKSDSQVFLEGVNLLHGLGLHLKEILLVRHRQLGLHVELYLGLGA